MCMQPLAKSFLIYASLPPQAPRSSRDCALSNVVALGWFECCEDVNIILLVFVCSFLFRSPVLSATLLLLLKRVARIHTGEGLWK